MICNLRDNICRVAISLVIEKTFNSVYHKGIIYKLITLGVDPFLVKIFYSYLNNRKFGIQINNVTLDLGPVNSGVPQGSVLTPFLFNIFLHDFPHYSGDSKTILYADYSLIFIHSKSPVKSLHSVAFHLGEISASYKKRDFKINAAKSQVICIGNFVQESKSLQLTLDGINIPFKNTIKYPGLQFVNLLKFNNHARSITEKTKRISGAFAILMHNRCLSMNTKLLIYKVAIRSVLCYGFPIWFTISPIVANELKKFERKILTNCIGKKIESFRKRYSNAYDIKMQTY